VSQPKNQRRFSTSMDAHSGLPLGAVRRSVNRGAVAGSLRGRGRGRTACRVAPAAGPGFRRSGVITVSDGGNLAAFACTKGADTSGPLASGFRLC
jgi:hypothetical protein